MVKNAKTFPEDDHRSLDGIDVYWMGDGAKDTYTTDATVFIEPASNLKSEEAITPAEWGRAELMAKYVFKKLQEYEHVIVEDINQDQQGFNFTLWFKHLPNGPARAALIDKFQNDMDIIYKQLKDTPSIYNPERAAQEAFTHGKLDLYKTIKTIVGDAGKAQEIMTAVEMHVYPSGKGKSTLPPPP